MCNTHLVHSYYDVNTVISFTFKVRSFEQKFIHQLKSMAYVIIECARHQYYNTRYSVVDDLSLSKQTDKLPLITIIYSSVQNLPSRT